MHTLTDRNTSTSTYIDTSKWWLFRPCRSVALSHRDSDRATQIGRDSDNATLKLCRVLVNILSLVYLGFMCRSVAKPLRVPFVGLSLYRPIFVACRYVFKYSGAVNVVSVTAVILRISPRWQAMFLVSFTIVDFETITQYSLVFHVIFNVLLNFKLKWYRISHSLIALKCRHRHRHETCIISIWNLVIR